MSIKISQYLLFNYILINIKVFFYYYYYYINYYFFEYLYRYFILLTIYYSI